MKTEISAGGIIVKYFDSAWHVLLMKDMNNMWTFPKGKIEKGETQEVAAAREIEEEVGLRDMIPLGSLPTLHYKYKRNGLISKTVYYFVFRYDGNETPVVQKEEGIKEAKWVPFARAITMVGYPQSNKPLLVKAQEMVTSI
jgi:8-oxo-dGTP diphosphatase